MNCNDEKTVLEYIRQNYKSVLKDPVGFIHYPFIDPGSVYDGNVWDWDTYWCVYGLKSLCERNDERLGGAPDIREESLWEYAKGNIRNFLDHQMDDGYIPMMIENKDLPEPYLNLQHKNGILMNMHKPFLCQQIDLISSWAGDYSWISGSIDKIDRYFECYDRYYFNNNCGLYVWRDDIMIGMDNDPASFGRPKSSTANIFLNSFMVMELNSAAGIYRKAGMPGKADVIMAKRERLIRSIHDECYDKRDNFFYSVDVDIKTRKYDWFHQGLGVFWKTLPIRIGVWSGFLPMYAGFATEDEAAHLVEHYHDHVDFGSEFGLTTLDKREKMFNLEATNNPSNWLGPVWIVANYCVFRGMLNYGYVEEARQICSRSLSLLGNDIRKTGCMHEYYDPFTGEPIVNGGFINWNMLVLNMAEELRNYAD